MARPPAPLRTNYESHKDRTERTGLTVDDRGRDGAVDAGLGVHVAATEWQPADDMAFLYRHDTDVGQEQLVDWASLKLFDNETFNVLVRSSLIVLRQLCHDQQRPRQIAVKNFRGTAIIVRKSVHEIR